MTDVWRAVMDAGVDAVPVDARYVSLREGSHAQRLRLHIFARPLSPSDVRNLIDRHPEPGLLVVPAATAAVREAIEHAGWSWLINGTTGVRGVLRLGAGQVTVGEKQTSQDEPVPGRPGPVPWGSLSLVRRLLQRPVTTQQMLAATAGVSQPRVSQTLTTLAGVGLVARRGGGWVVLDFDGLLRWWLDRYPGPGGISTYWFGLNAPQDQARAALDLLWTCSTGATEAAGGEPAVLSGDVAADLLAPWRTPVRAVIYARVGADLGAAGLTPSGAEEATLELTLPQDHGVWSPPGNGGEAIGRPSATLPLADPVQILWDVRRGPGPDSDEAAERVWDLLRERHRLLQCATGS
jgi:hypothetical protein